MFKNVYSKLIHQAKNWKQAKYHSTEKKEITFLTYSYSAILKNIRITNILSTDDSSEPFAEQKRLETKEYYKIQNTGKNQNL